MGVSAVMIQGTMGFPLNTTNGWPIHAQVTGTQLSQMTHALILYNFGGQLECISTGAGSEPVTIMELFR